MYTAIVSTVLLSSLLAATTHAFVPVDIQPLPSDLDTALWVPVATFAPITPSPTPSPSPSLNILPALDANIIPDLKRQVTGQGAAAAATGNSQVSPITTYYINSAVAPGSFVQVPIVYTQTFPSVPDQWAAAVSGEIGLGTIVGTVGVVSKRSLPTQAPLADEIPLEEGEKSEVVQKEEGGEKEEADSAPLMDKFRKLGKEIQEEITALMNKEKKKPHADCHDKDEAMTPLSKEVKVSTSTDREDAAAVPLEKEEKMHSSLSTSIEHTDSVVMANDADRALKARTLAVLAVGIATVCVSYL